LRELDAIDDLVKAGRTADARALLHAVDLPRMELGRVRLASLWRRVGLCTRALGVLHPVLFPEDAREGRREERRELQGSLLRHAPREDAFVEYVLNLSRLGGAEQSIRLVEDYTRDASKIAGIDPELLYALAVSYTLAWKYPLAKSTFEAWLRTQEPDAYRTAVGRLNHAHCSLRLEDYPSARTSLEGLRELSRDRGWSLVHANACELYARLRYLEGAMTESQEVLGEALQGLADRSLSDRLSALRLKATLTFEKDANRGLKELMALRFTALSQGHGETAREIDLFLALKAGHRACALRVFYGSPQPWFEEKSRSCAVELGKTWSFRGKFFAPVRNRTEAAQGADRLLALASKRFASSGKELVTARLVQCLVSDFYRGWPLVSLHVALYPDRLFHPVHSANLIRALVANLRNAIDPDVARINHSSNGYRLLLGARPVSFRRFTSESLKQQPREPVVTARTGFSVSEFATEHNLPRRTAQRLLTNRVEAGIYSRVGRGPATRYFILRDAMESGQNP
jgi:hypothetical protein